MGNPFIYRQFDRSMEAYFLKIDDYFTLTSYFVLERALIDGGLIS